MNLKVPWKKVLHYVLPAIISMVVLFIISYFLKGSVGGEGTSTSIIYVMALFIAGGYFFISAVLLYLMKLLRAMVPSKKEAEADLIKQQSFLKRLKKTIEKRYYFTKDIDEATFRQELQEIARKEIELEEKLAQIEDAKNEKNKKENKDEKPKETEEKK